MLSSFRSTIVLDGEAMCGNSFDDLWNRAADECVRAPVRLRTLGTQWLRLARQAARRAEAPLARLLRNDRDGLEYVPHLQGNGDLIFEHICKLGLEGLVCKRTDVPYQAGRSKHWLKLKNRAHPAIMRVREAFEEERRRG